MDQHLIILSTGKSDEGKAATLALNIGLAALAVGDGVRLFLTMGGSCWAYPQCAAGVQVGGYETVEELMERYLELGGELLLCARCVDGLCGQPCPAQREIRPAVGVAGMARLAELACESVVYTF